MDFGSLVNNMFKYVDLFLWIKRRNFLINIMIILKSPEKKRET